MKIHGWVIGLLFLLISCQANISQAPSIEFPVTETPSASASNTPFVIFTNTMEPTPTEITIPEYMKEFIEKEYDDSGKPDILYAHLELVKAKFPNQPIKYKGVQIFSWLTGISYVDQNGIFHNDGIILDGICKEDDNDFIFDMSGSSQISHSPFCPSMEYFKNQRKGIDKIVTDWNVSIAELQLGVGEDTQTERSALYSDIFPDIEPVEISGIGTVLPVTKVKFVGINADEK